MNLKGRFGKCEHCSKDVEYICWKFKADQSGNSRTLKLCGQCTDEEYGKLNNYQKANWIQAEAK